MLSSDKNVETISQLIEMVKHNIELRKEYAKLDVVEKVVRLLTMFALALLVVVLVFAILLFTSAALAVWLSQFIELYQSLLVVSGFYLLVLLLGYAMRKSWIERPLIRPYQSLEEIQMRKEQLSEVIDLENQEIKRLWDQLAEKDEELSRGEQIAQFIKYGFMAYDGFMTFRKLKNSYGSILNIFRR